MGRPKKLKDPRQIHTLIEGCQYDGLQRLAKRDKRKLAELFRDAVVLYLDTMDGEEK